MSRNDYNPTFTEDAHIGTAIALLELCSVARGVETADAILWQSDIELLFATPVQPGKYVMLFTGSVEDLRQALGRGRELAGGDLVDELLIPQVHEQVEQGLRRRGGFHLHSDDGDVPAIGIVETTTVASAILAADRSLKTATVDMLDLRIANGLGGKSFYTLLGDVADVRSAVAAGAELAQERGLLARDVVIPRPHRDLVPHL